MSGKIPRAFIDDLLTRVDIVDLIDSHVPLKKTGSNYVARCPFHNEKSPSFSVSRSKQFYHCFGCGVGGNAISFVMEFNHLNFIEAIEDLAAFVGVSVPREVVLEREAVESRSLSEVYAVLQRVAAYYVEQLRSSVEGKSAVAYLKARGIGAEVASEYMLGYAPKDWQGLENQFPRQELLAAGLLVTHETGRVYDRFRERVMFPIRDKRGRVIAFGARVLDDSLPKYLNSPETEVFQKGKEVYGLSELLAKNGRPKRILLVEGYMDVIALAQAGIHYAVAALGTAASKAHLELLFRYSSELVLCFDGDAAGRAAAWRVMEAVFLSLKEGRQVRIMLLPQGQDPDSLIRSEGAEAFVERVASAHALSEYFFQHLLTDVSSGDIEGRARLVEMAQPFINKLAEGVYREMMQAKLNALAGLKVAEGSKERPVARQNMPSSNVSGQLLGRVSSARTAVALLLQNPDLVDVLEQKKIDWQLLDFPGKSLLFTLMHKIIESNPANTAMVLELFRESTEYPQVLALAQMDLQLPESGIQLQFMGAIDRLIEQASEKLYTELLKKNLTDLTLAEKEMLKKMRINN
jgi:DNA primase